MALLSALKSMFSRLVILPVTASCKRFAKKHVKYVGNKLRWRYKMSKVTIVLQFIRTCIKHTLARIRRVSAYTGFTVSVS